MWQGGWIEVHDDQGPNGRVFGVVVRQESDGDEGLVLLVQADEVPWSAAVVKSLGVMV